MIQISRERKSIIKLEISEENYKMYKVWRIKAEVGYICSCYSSEMGKIIQRLFEGFSNMLVGRGKDIRV